MGGQASSISSFDAARVAAHVAGSGLLTGNQLLVADVSNNGSISSFDASQIARVVTSTTPYGLTGTWKFLPASRNYALLSGTLSGEDFAALLMGEVSGNWIDNGTRPAGGKQLAVSSKKVVGSSGPERGIAVEMASVEGAVGKEVVVPVNVRGVADKGVISYEFDLRYDPSVIQPVVDAVDVQNTVSRGLSVVTNATEPGLLRVVVYGAYPIVENGVLLNLRFTAVGVAGVVSHLSLERFMFNEGDPVTLVTDGLVELVVMVPD